MFLIAEVADHTIGVALIAAIASIIGIVLGGSITFLIEGYKIREARRDASEARRLAVAKAAEDQRRYEEQLAASSAVQGRLREMMAHLTSQIVALNESRLLGKEQEPEIVAELGIDVEEIAMEDGEQPEAEVIPPIVRRTGTRILWLNSTLVNSPRYVHFSWNGDAFKIRDYMGGRLQQHLGSKPQAEDGFDLDVCHLDRDEVWSASKDRIQMRGELIHGVSDFDWWRRKLDEMTLGRNLMDSPKRIEWGKDRIIQTLDRHCRRATYGALAKIVGENAAFVMEGRERSKMNSWIVAVKTVAATESRRGWPTKYADQEIHPECFRQIRERLEDFIIEPSSLLGWLEVVG